jgi:hypothetical protein
MKQLLPLFLFLLPCLVLAQYPTNGNQKITLGEQTTADGLVYRGVLADTGIITPSSDTSAYIILDTVNNRFYNYNRATNVWSMAGVGSISSGLTGVLPVANGGTGASSFTPNNYLIRTNSSGIFDTSAVYEANGRVGIGTATPSAQLNFVGDYTFSGLQPFEMSRSGVSRDDARFLIANGVNDAGQFLPFFQGISNTVSSGVAIGFILQGAPQEDNSSTDVGIRFDGRRKDNTSMTTGAIVEFTNRNSPVMRIMGSGNLGIGQSTPTAVLHLKAGTATASTAPLKFTSGTNLTTAEAGAMEFNGTNLFFSPSTTRHTVNHGLTGSATLDFLSTNAQNSRDMTIAVTGAADGDVVSIGVPNAAVNANTSYSAWVSAANTVTVRFNNYSSGTVDPASGLFKVFVTK